MNRKGYFGLAMAVCMAASSFTAVSAAEEEYDLYNPPVVTVEQGQLQGYMDGDTYAFLGVPYATAERFELPQEVEAWEGIRNAQAYGKVCRIPDQTSVGADEFVWPHRYWIQGEDCQNLNIWTQHLDETAKKPVMVFFHGGGHNNGSSIESAAYEGTNLSEYGDVVVVTVNHRLNVLGYIDLSEYGEEYEDCVNLGTADMVAALQWIHDNIETFGGDPDNVTIFGQSGGGSKVQTMMHTPSAEGLFHKVIIQSGGGVGNAFLGDAEGKKLAAQYTLENLGLDESTIDEIKTVDYDDLIAAGVAANQQAAEELGISVNWGPEADGTLVTEEYCEWAKDIPVMVGSVFAEQNHSWEVDNGGHASWDEETTMAYLTERYGDSAQAIAEEFAAVFPEKHVSDVYFYDASRRIRVYGQADDFTANLNAPVYTYLFAYEAPVNGGTIAFHCVDLIYSFHNVDIPIITRATGGDETAHKLQDEVAGAWVSFAYTGSPSTETLAWEPYTTEEPNLMVFDTESSCRILNDTTLNTLVSEALAAK